MLNEDRWYDSFVTRYRVRLESKETERFWAVVSFLLGIALAIIFGWWVLKYQTPENGSYPIFQIICASLLGFVLGAWVGIALSICLLQMGTLFARPKRRQIH